MELTTGGLSHCGITKIIPSVLTLFKLFKIEDSEIIHFYNHADARSVISDVTCTIPYVPMVIIWPVCKSCLVMNYV